VSTRTERLSDLIRDEISRLLLREIKDPRIGFVTITGATVSADLRHARVFVSVLGEEAARQASLAALRGAAGFIQRALFRNLRLKHPPAVTFHLDDSMARGERIERVLRQIRESGEGSRGEGEA
jgi:ribosome-binding factor A